MEKFKQVSSAKKLWAKFTTPVNNQVKRSKKKLIF